MKSRVERRPRIIFSIGMRGCTVTTISCMTFLISLEMKMWQTGPEVVDHHTMRNKGPTKDTIGFRQSIRFETQQVATENRQKKNKQIKFLCDSRIGDDFFFVLLSSFVYCFGWIEPRATVTKRIDIESAAWMHQTKNEIENNRQIMCASGGSMCAGRFQAAFIVGGFFDEDDDNPKKIYIIFESRSRAQASEQANAYFLFVYRDKPIILCSASFVLDTECVCSKRNPSSPTLSPPKISVVIVLPSKISVDYAYKWAMG